ncbi:two-component system response regulator [Halopseudomonas pachastrellae]|jgi:DNA-binding response OmpR family regulator|uniref:Two-component system response regulator n=1 Tax=Halopseudomonas pachastrellae TaxID=254161 RepID=A0A1S8DE46_9GAMM|nr:response regulator transcription factor [Halopseudomonas pachastrellae]ONM43086.1 two-component system response regulator [Halopseudomonas pachastrellae]SFM30517.1 DNA-binding response regulator, OmpR family, contains REC and winged-helix (wHTH) domain [Halopseudomonas pachastrellae]
MKLLIVEDHPSLRDLLARHLRRSGFVVDAAEDGKAALAMLELSQYDAMLLDLGLPDMDGLQLLSLRSRSRNPHLPCLILTARDALHSRIAGLDAGADDYLLKPFEMGELEARLRAVLRRAGPRPDTRLYIGNLSFCEQHRDVQVDARPLVLPKRELALLEELLRSAPRVVVKDHLEERLYALDQAVTPNAIEAAVSRLRRKLAKAGADASIETLRGLGYRLTQRQAI